MVTCPNASRTPSFAIMRFARASSSRASSSLPDTPSPPFQNFRCFIVCWPRGDQSFLRQFETVERKAGCHGAASERPMTETFRCLPSAGWHHRLWDFACMDISAETEDFFFRAIDQFKFERRARVIVPNFRLRRCDASANARHGPAETESPSRQVAR